MKQTITRNEKDGKPIAEKKQDKKFLSMIIDDKLKDPSPSVIKKISVELGLDIL